MVSHLNIQVALPWGLPGNTSGSLLCANAGHNLSGIASQFAMQFGLNCDVIHVLHRSD